VRIAVTGAHGFIGTQLCRTLQAEGHEVRPIGRSASDDESASVDWATPLRSSDAIIHLAARAHVTNERAADPLAEFRKVNVELTRRLAQAAVEAGVGRFVFVSSIGVLGTATRDRPFSETSPVAPQEPYALSKLEAETLLRDVESQGGPEVVIVRPTLVYGPHAKGNLLRLMRLTRTGLPLPFGSVRNARSYVGLRNLCDLLSLCAITPGARGGTFLAADEGTLSTPELLTLMAEAMGRPARLVRCPLSILAAATRLVGLHNEFLRLTGDLRVDAGHARKVLQWRPRQNVQTGIGEMARCFLEGTKP
jgi:nucleoside-diphosphate-sugar epimerase